MKSLLFSQILDIGSDDLLLTCGYYHAPFAWTSTTNEVKVTFSSDMQNEGRGFYMGYEAMPSAKGEFFFVLKIHEFCGSFVCICLFVFISVSINNKRNIQNQYIEEIDQKRRITQIHQYSYNTAGLPWGPSNTTEMLWLYKLSCPVLFGKGCKRDDPSLMQ